MSRPVPVGHCRSVLTRKEAIASSVVAAVRPGRRLAAWQATRIVRARSALQRRPDFRVVWTRRLSATVVLVRWSEPGYLGPDDGRDFGTDRVELRGNEFWVKDDSVGDGIWLRWL